MYSDPKRVRSKRITLRFDDYEHALIEALAHYQGDQIASLLHNVIMREASAVLNHPTAASVSEPGA